MKHPNVANNPNEMATGFSDASPPLRKPSVFQRIRTLAQTTLLEFVFAEMLRAYAVSGAEGLAETFLSRSLDWKEGKEIGVLNCR